MSDAHIRDGKWSSTFALKELGTGCDGLGDKSAELFGGLVLAGKRFEDAFTVHLHERRDPRGDLADDAAPNAGNHLHDHAREIVGPVVAQPVAADQRCYAR